MAEFQKDLDSEIILVDEFKTELRKDISIPRTTVFDIAPSSSQSILIDLVTMAMEELERKADRHAKNKRDEGEKKERRQTRGSIEYESNCNNVELKFWNLILMSINDEVPLSEIEFLLEAKQGEYENAKRILAVAHEKTVFGKKEELEHTQKQTKFLEVLDRFKVFIPSIHMSLSALFSAPFSFLS